MGKLHVHHLSLLLLSLFSSHYLSFYFFWWVLFWFVFIVLLKDVACLSTGTHCLESDLRVGWHLNLKPPQFDLSRPAVLHSLYIFSEKACLRNLSFSAAWRCCQLPSFGRKDLKLEKSCPPLLENTAAVTYESSKKLQMQLFCLDSCNRQGRVQVSPAWTSDCGELV